MEDRLTIERQRWANVVAAVCSLVVAAVASSVVVLAFRDHAYILGLLGLLALAAPLNFLAINVRRSMSREPLLSFSMEGVDDPLRILGLDRLSWDQVAAIYVTHPARGSAALVIETRRPVQSLIRFLAIPRYGRPRSRFSIDRYLTRNAELTIEALPSVAPPEVSLGKPARAS